MNITSVTVENFRNIKHVEFSPEKGVNIICGENGQGKTNLIEAIWLCTGAKTFRSGIENDFIPLEKQTVPKIKIKYYRDNRINEIITVFGEDKKTLLNGIAVPLRSKLAGEFLSVIFSPDDLSLIKSSPSNRRKFMDTAICQMYPNYISLLRRYQKTLSQRNALLKSIRYNQNEESSIMEWNEIISQTGKKIEKYREKFILQIKEEAINIYRGISDDREKFDIFYEKGRDENLAYEDCLLRSFERDKITKTTNIGIHKDDLIITLDKKSSRLFGSQGQQRSCVLSLKLAEANMIREMSGSSPIILLDDVMSELDDRRRKYVMEKTKEYQVFITCCEPWTNDENINGIKRHLMKNGDLS